MNYKVRNREKGIDAFKVTLFFFFLFTITFSGILKYGMLFTDLNKTGINSFYREAINFSVPYIKASAQKNEDISENPYTVKNILAKALNMSLDAPQTIIAKEIPILFKKIPNATTSVNKDSSLYNLIKSFTLNDGDIVLEQKSTIPTLPNTTGGTLNTFEPKLAIKASSKPQVLIYHSHTREAYNDTGSNTQANPNLSVVAVGQVLGDELKKYGYNVIHDTEDHSIDYNNAYLDSRQAVKNYLNKYGSFQLIIDLHRDAGSIKSAFTYNLNNTLLSKVMFVADKTNTFSTQNIALANNLTELGNSLYPGLIKPPEIYNHGIVHFNGDLSSNSMLIEVGADCNTLQESKNTASALSRIIAQYLYNKNPH